MLEGGESARAGAAVAGSAGASADAAAPPESVGKDASGRRGDTPRKRARVTIEGDPTDRELEAFGEFAHSKPELAAMVVAIVAVVFFAPVLAIALILWYRMRKARMLHDTMLTLAEKGIVTPDVAMNALAGNKEAAAVAPFYDQAKQIRRRAAWSDLRKGVMVGGFGLALSIYSLLEEREANALGLVLLFVGIGFVFLWWFESRQLVAPNRAPQEMAPGPGSASAPEDKGARLN